MVLGAMAQKKQNEKANVKGSESFVDSVPHFMYEKAELDTFLIFCARIPWNAERYGINCTVKMAFRVDSNRRITNADVLHSEIFLNSKVQFSDYNTVDTAKALYEKEAERLLMLTDGLWIPGNKEGEYTDHKVVIDINFNTEAYDKNNDWRYKFVKGGISNQVKQKYFYDYGVKKMNQKKLHAAILYFNEALRVNPGDLDALYNSGIAYKKTGNLNKACESWRKGGSLGDAEAQKLADKYCSQ